MYSGETDDRHWLKEHMYAAFFPPKRKEILFLFFVLAVDLMRNMLFLLLQKVVRYGTEFMARLSKITPKYDYFKIY